MGAGTGTGGIPTTDKTPERTEILIIYPINNEYNKIKRFKKSVVDIPPVHVPIPEENSVAHICF